MADEEKKLRTILLEYEALRDEILHRQKETTDTLIYSILSTGALLGYGFTVQLSVIFLVPLAILVPLSYSIKKNADTILFIASYISTTIEGNVSDLKWESFRYKFRRYESQKRGRLPRLIECIMIYDFLSITCLLLAFFYWDYPLIYFGIVAALVFVYLLWWNITSSSSYSYHRQTKIMGDIEKVAKDLN